MFTYLILKFISRRWSYCLVILFIHLAKIPSIHSVIKRRGIYINLFYLLLLFHRSHLKQDIPSDFAMPAFMHSMRRVDCPLIYHFKNILDFLYMQRF